MKKKVLSLLLTFGMLFTLIPVFGVSVVAMDFSGWTKITNDTNEISDNGNYYLDDDVNTKITVKQDVEATIDLNGHVLQGDSSDGSVITNYGKLTIKDSDVEASTPKEHYFKYKRSDEWVLNDAADTMAKTDAIEVSAITSATAEDTLIKVTGGVITGGDVEGRGGAICSAGELTLRDINIVGNKADSDGGGIFVGENAGTNLYNCNFYGNKAGSNGGAIYTKANMLVKDCFVQVNTAISGGGIYSEETIITILNSNISNNIASTNGGGIYVDSSSGSACFADGTKITMADGSIKNIEDVKEDELVRTFDHETGGISSERVCFVFKSETQEDTFTLHFTNDIDLSIIGGHALLEKESRKYVVLTEENVHSYIGKHFYNAGADRWEILLNYTKESEKHDYYSIYSANHLDCLANGMLSIPDDTHVLVNIFELDENLKIDQVKKQEDIAKYGLLKFEDIQNIERFEKKVFEDFNIEYIKIVLGKGLSSYDKIMEIWKETDAYLAKKENPLFATSMQILNSSGGVEETYETYLTSANKGTLLIGSNVTIRNNAVNEEANNVYLDSAATISLIDTAVANTIDVGVTKDGGTGEITTNYIDTVEKYFSSDSEDYFVKVDENRLTLDKANVKIAAGIKNGNVIVDNQGAMTGDTVTITATPCSKYRLDNITVKDANNDDITVSGNTFSMPSEEDKLPVTVSASFKKLSSAGSIKTYVISTTGDAHGSVNVSTKSTYAGNTVTLTVKADKGWTLETITAKDAKDNEISLVAIKSGETYTFKMPSSKVTVSATFMEDNTMLNFFVDVKATDYYYDAVLWAAENGITSGVDNLHFAPNGITTRAEMVTLLWRAFSCPEPKAATCIFTDVPAGSYYEKAVIWGYENGYIKGVSETAFAPEATVTRGQSIAFLARMNNVKDEDSGYGHSFNDVVSDDYFNNAVAWAVANNITVGITETTFEPNLDCSRSQIMTFIYRSFVK